MHISAGTLLSYFTLLSLVYKGLLVTGKRSNALRCSRNNFLNYKKIS